MNANLMNANLMNVNLNESMESLMRQDEYGKSILHNICESGDEKTMIITLDKLRRGLNENTIKKFLNIKDKQKNTAMHVAMHNGSDILINLLVLYGADKSIINSSNESIDIMTDDSTSNNKIVKCNNKQDIQKLFEDITKATNNSPVITEEDNNDRIDTGTIEDSFKSISTIGVIDLREDNSKPNNKPNMLMNGGVSDYSIELLQSQIYDMIGGAEKKVTKKVAEKKVAENVAEKKVTKKVAEKKVTKKVAEKKVAENVAEKKVTKKVAEKKVAENVAEKKVIKKITNIDVNSTNKYSKDDIHAEVVSMIRDLGYDESESKIIKAGLYSMTKETHPELNGRDRALKMKSYVKKDKIKNIDITAVKQAIEINRAAKEKGIREAK